MHALERQHEQHRLALALEDAAAGRGAAVVLEGPAGIGTSSLVEHTRALAKARGFGRLQASGDDAERAVPWGVVRQLVERSTSRYAGELRQAILAGPAGRALFALDRAPASAAEDESAFARTLHALWWVAVDLSSTRPLLITVDDAHWADVASQRFLTYLARRLTDLPVALVVGTRPPQEAAGPLVELASGRLAERLTPQPLSATAVGELAGRRGERPLPATVEALHAAAGGNPFLTGQLLDELATRGLDLHDAATAAALPALGPQTVSRALLSGLPDDARALADAAAVLGGRSDLALAGELAGLGPGQAEQALDTLVAGQVMTSAAPELAFVHSVVREAVLASLRAGQRAALHATAAQLLHARGEGAVRVAVHLSLAPTGTLPDDVQVLRAAAAVLLAEGDARTAAGHLQRALEAAGDDADLRAELGRALLRAGDPAPARMHLLAAADPPCPGLERARRLADAAAATLALEGPSAAAAELDLVLDQAGPELSEDARLLLEARLGGVSSFTAAASQRWSARALARYADLPGRTQDERALLALLAQKALYGGRTASDVAELGRRALRDGRYLAEGGDIVVWGNALHAMVCADVVDLVREEIARARVRLRSGGTPLEFALLNGINAFLASREGEVLTAEAEATTALASLTLADPGTAVEAARAVCVRLSVQAALDRGDLTTATASLAAYDAGVEHEVTLPAQRLRLVRAQLALVRDDPVTAAAEAEELGAAELAVGIDNPALGWRLPAALAALRLGDDDRARTLAAEQLATARAWGAGTDLGAALRLAARVAPERRLSLLEEAVAALEPAPARLELAAALADLGEALRVERRRADARAPLRRAAELAHACGARVLQARALDALAALGDRPRRLSISGLDSLTASERRVAELAGHGRTNRDIAQDLFVTPKTVENHLGRVYVKLGITGRRELVRVLA